MRPGIERSIAEKQQGQKPRADLISLITHDAKNSREASVERIAGIIGSTAAGAIHSSAALVMAVIVDLAANPKFMEEVRKEIRETHKKLGGRWSTSAFQDLVKLDSAMKETTRLSPSTNIVYMRAILQDHTLSNNLKLESGKYLCISGTARAMEETVFSNPNEYDALRYYNKDLDGHLARPFNNSHAEDYRWGSGRWACPGRFIATLFTKMIIVKIVDEYDISFPDGCRPKLASLHEFNFMLPNSEILMRRREKSLDIKYSE